MTHYSRTGHNIVSLPHLPPYPLSSVYVISWSQLHRKSSLAKWQIQTDWGQTCRAGRWGCEKIKKCLHRNFFALFFSVRTSSEVNLKGQLQTDEKDTIASQKDELGGGRLESNLISSTRPLAPKCSAIRLLTTKKETNIRDQNFNKSCGILKVDMYIFWLYRLGSYLAVDQLSHYMINLSVVNL